MYDSPVKMGTYAFSMHLKVLLLAVMNYVNRVLAGWKMEP